MNLEKYIEHTLLKPDATKQELDTLFEEARQHRFLGVCINPSNVAYAKEQLQNTNVKIVTVVGFPLGATLTESKAFEAQNSIKLGADEIDMVINIGKLKDQEFDFVENDIRVVKQACGGKVLKVIIETDLLSNAEIEVACDLSVRAGADMVKTSTGFVKDGMGAKVEDVGLMAEIVKPKGLKVKASAGIRDKQKALDLIHAGADRLGTSSGVLIVS